MIVVVEWTNFDGTACVTEFPDENDAHSYMEDSVNEVVKNLSDYVEERRVSRLSARVLMANDDIYFWQITGVRKWT